VRWIRRLAALLGFVLVLLIALAAFYVQRSLPQMSGSLALPGLSAPVKVQRDASDVTHILATRRSAAGNWSSTVG
jgi:penicillin G amidase